MNDPHVVSLEYKLETDEESLRFDSPEPLEGDAGGFTYRLADGMLTVKMKDHYATTEEAVEAVRPFIRSWELDYALTNGRREMWFTFVQPTIIDRKPTPGAAGHILFAGTGKITITGHPVTLTITRRKYPEPPAAFVASGDVELLWTRYENQLLGREHLPAMGYFLTVVETRYGMTPSSGTSAAQRRRTTTKRKATAAALNVELAILEKLGELTTERGDATTARKQDAGAPLRPLTEQEGIWIREALRKITRRVGMKEAGAAIPPLTMADLPTV